MNREVLREISAISRVVAAMREREFSRYGLKRGQHAYLTRIVENPGISQKELTEMLKVDKGTTAKAVKKLIDEGYAYKERSAVNYKAVELYPTPEGRKIYPVLVEEIERTGEEALKGIEDVADVLKILKRMRENLEKEWNRSI